MIDGIVNGVGHNTKTDRRMGLQEHRPDASSTAPSTAPARSPPRPATRLQPVQSGKVNQYGALLFGAVAVGAIVLVIVNVN